MNTCIICYNSNINLTQLCRCYTDGYCTDCCHKLYINNNRCPLCRSKLTYWVLDNSIRFIKNKLTLLTNIEKKFIYIRLKYEITQTIRTVTPTKYYAFIFKNNSTNIFIGKIITCTNNLLNLSNIIVVSRQDGFIYTATPNNRTFQYNFNTDEIFEINNYINVGNFNNYLFNNENRGIIPS